MTTITTASPTAIVSAPSDGKTAANRPADTLAAEAPHQRVRSSPDAGVRMFGLLLENNSPDSGASEKEYGSKQGIILRLPALCPKPKVEPEEQLFSVPSVLSLVTKESKPENTESMCWHHVHCSTSDNRKAFFHHGEHRDHGEHGEHRDHREHRGHGEKALNPGFSTFHQAAAMPVAATPGDAVLHNLLVAATRPDATAARPMSAKAELCALVQKLAERILVSVPSSAGGTEVRITLKTPSLEGTDVVIHRLQGELQVRLLPANAEVQALAQQLRSDLQTALVEKFTGSHVSVDIDTAPQGDTDTDGRSRNPYVAEDDTEETQSRWP